MRTVKKIIGALIYLAAVSMAWCKFGYRAAAAAALASVGIAIINSATIDGLDEMLKEVIDVGFALVEELKKAQGIALDEGTEEAGDE